MRTRRVPEVFKGEVGQRDDVVPELPRIAGNSGLTRSKAVRMSERRSGVGIAAGSVLAVVLSDLLSEFVQSKGPNTRGLSVYGGGMPGWVGFGGLCHRSHAGTSVWTHARIR